MVTSDNPSISNFYYLYIIMGLRNRTGLLDYRCFFITTTCYNFLHLFNSNKYFKILYDSIVFLNKKYNAYIMGYVLMPNHIHLILYFDKENKLSEYMRDFKKFTSIEIRRQIEKDGRYKLLDELRYEKRQQKFRVWQHRFDDVVLYTRKVLETKLEYIHQNPVKAGIVDFPTEYIYSSAGFYENGTNSQIDILNYNEFF